jgi:hypothetical protein
MVKQEKFTDNDFIICKKAMLRDSVGPFLLLVCFALFVFFTELEPDSTGVNRFIPFISFFSIAFVWIKAVYLYLYDCKQKKKIVIHDVFISYNYAHSDTCSSISIPGFGNLFMQGYNQRYEKVFKNKEVKSTIHISKNANIILSIEIDSYVLVSVPPAFR